MFRRVLHQNFLTLFSSSQKFASKLYIVALFCIPNYPGVMSQLTTGDYVTKFESQRFRVQLSGAGLDSPLVFLWFTHLEAQFGRGLHFASPPTKFGKPTLLVGCPLVGVGP